MTWIRTAFDVNLMSRQGHREEQNDASGSQSNVTHRRPLTWRMVGIPPSCAGFGVDGTQPYRVS